VPATVPHDATEDRNGMRATATHRQAAHLAQANGRLSALADAREPVRGSYATLVFQECRALTPDELALRYVDTEGPRWV